MRLSEIDHSYDDVESFLKANPIKHSDRLRVFHGFRDFADAVSVAKHGLTGASHAARVYSYEADNNPKGLFVTMKFDVAADFVGAYGAQVIIEFMANGADLEAPAWPGGSYTVQGQMSQYFGRGAKGRAARRQTQKADDEAARKKAEGEPEFFKAVAGSDRANMALLLLHSREHQALFVGHLNPQQIAAFHVRPDYKGKWERLSREEFMERYGDTKLSHERDPNRVFLPNDTFDGETFMAKLGQDFGKNDIEEIVAGLWQDVVKSQQPTRTFLSYFEPFLWPKQYVPCMQWMKAKWGGRRKA